MGSFPKQSNFHYLLTHQTFKIATTAGHSLANPRTVCWKSKMATTAGHSLEENPM